jgi:hypothetical protein
MPGNSWLNEIAALPVFPASPYLPYGEYPQGKSRSSEMWDDIGDAHRLSSIKLRYIGQFMRIVAERKGIELAVRLRVKAVFLASHGMAGGQRR